MNCALVSVPLSGSSKLLACTCQPARQHPHCQRGAADTNIVHWRKQQLHYGLTCCKNTLQSYLLPLTAVQMAGSQIPRPGLLLKYKVQLPRLACRRLCSC